MADIHIIDAILNYLGKRLEPTNYETDYSSNGICVSYVYIIGCLPVPQSSIARPFISHLKYAFFLTGGAPVLPAVSFIFQIDTC